MSMAELDITEADFADLFPEDDVEAEVTDDQDDVEVDSDESTDEDDFQEVELADDESEAEPEDEPEEELFTIKVSGETKQLTRDQLIELAQKGEDYTRKTQALAAERQQATQYQALEAALAEDFDGTIAFLRETFAPGPSAADIAEMDPLELQVHKLTQAHKALEAESQQLKAEKVRQAVEAELATVKQTYEPDNENFDVDALLAYAVEHKFPNLDSAYRNMNWDKRPAVAAPQDESRQRKVAAKRNAPPVVGGNKRSSKTATKGASEYPSFEEAFGEALSEAGWQL